MTKKIIALAAFGIFALCGCTAYEKTDGKISIVCTTFPQYDWTRELIKGAEDKYELTYITENGTDIHSFQPSADDIVKIKNCNLIIYTGGESDEWIEEYAKDIKSVNMLKTVGDETLYDTEANETDEHTWLSLDNAEKICREIADSLKKIDPTGEDLYESNEENYEKQLDILDEKYELLTKTTQYDTVVVADRFPFRYLFDDYDIKYFAAFSGCSAETEASFETVKLLSEKAENVPAVLVTDEGNIKLAQTVISNTSDKSKPIISLNSMQSVTKEDAQITYLSVMEDNLSKIEQALGN